MTYLALLADVQVPHADPDAARVKYREIPDLTFDHHAILSYAYERLCNKIE